MCKIRVTVTRDDLVAELTRRFPGGMVPTGGGIALARELGVGIGDVASARRAAGIDVAPPVRKAPRRTPPPFKPPRAKVRAEVVVAHLEARSCEDKRVLPGTYRAVGELVGLGTATVTRIAKAHGFQVAPDSWQWSMERARRRQP